MRTSSGTRRSSGHGSRGARGCVNGRSGVYPFSCTRRSRGGVCIPAAGVGIEAVVVLQGVITPITVASRRRLLRSINCRGSSGLRRGFAAGIVIVIRGVHCGRGRVCVGRRGRVPFTRFQSVKATLKCRESRLSYVTVRATLRDYLPFKSRDVGLYRFGQGGRSCAKRSPNSLLRTGSGSSHGLGDGGENESFDVRCVLAGSIRSHGICCHGEGTLRCIRDLVKSSG